MPRQCCKFDGHHDVKMSEEQILAVKVHFEWELGNGRELSKTKRGVFTSIVDLMLKHLAHYQRSSVEKLVEAAADERRRTGSI